MEETFKYLDFTRFYDLRNKIRLLADSHEVQVELDKVPGIVLP